jgi:DNA-binding XRE family transcriptional regulator
VPDRCYDQRCRTGPRQINIATPEMQEMGARVRVGRHAAGLSQRVVAYRAGVSQSEVSRLERGLGGNISTYRFVNICFAIGPSFPFGDCPHHHNCLYTRPRSDRSPQPGALR